MRNGNMRKSIVIADICDDLNRVEASVFRPVETYNGECFFAVSKEYLRVLDLFTFNIKQYRRSQHGPIKEHGGTDT